MKKTAGHFLQDRMAQLTKLGMAGGGVLVGLGIGGLLFLADRWINPLGVIVLYVASAAAVYFAVRVLDHPKFKWNLSNLEKGASAERHVGHAIEYAITARNCAVAHSVTKIAKVGDIDHIVATPVAVWVIETKYKKVPKKHFSDVLKYIAANTDAVRQWAPDGTIVRGCLVLAHDSERGKKIFHSGKEKITAYFTPKQLVQEIRAEAATEQSLDEQVKKDVRKLGQVAE